MAQRQQTPELRISSEIRLPLDVVTNTTAILGIRGTGKTNTATVLVEEALSHGQRSIVVDPLDVWWGLKSSADGNSPGFDVVVFGGHHGDLPLLKDQGSAIADLLVENPITAVLSLRHLRKGEQSKFVTDFCERLYHRKGEAEYRDRLLVVIDEASSFVPQAFQGEIARCVGAVEDLVRRGRSSGIGVCLIDQRAASVNKNVLSQLEILIAHRQVSPQDRKALKDWVEAADDGESTKELLRTIAGIGQGEAKGEAWIWSPYYDLFRRTRIRKRTTFDSSRTPGPGETPAVPSITAKIDLDSIRAALATVVEEANDNDPKVLKARIKALEEAAQKPNQDSIDDAVQAATAELVQKIDAFELAQSIAAGIAQDFSISLEETLAHSRRLFDSLVLGDELNALIAKNLAPTQEPSHQLQEAQIVRRPTKVEKEGVSAPQQKILNAIAWWERIVKGGCTRLQAGYVAGYSPQSGNFNNLCGQLRTAEYVDYPSGGKLALTNKGRSMADSPQSKLTLQDFHTAIYDKLTGPQAKILRLIIGFYPFPIERTRIAEEAEYSASSGNFNNILGSLKSLELIEYPVKGHVVASAMLFPEGLN